MKVWILMYSFAYEGYSDPKHVFSSEEAADEIAKTDPEFEVFEMIVDEPTKDQP